MSDKTNRILKNDLINQKNDLNHRIRELENLLSQKERTIENLKQGEPLYKRNIDNMEMAYAYCKIILEDGNPCDFIFLEVNKAFEEIIGLNREILLGKPTIQAFPGIETDLQEWIDIFGRVALNRQSTTLEQYSAALNKWFSVLVYSPLKEHFCCVFFDISKQIAEKKVFEKQATIGKIRSQRLESIFNSTGMGIYCLDNDGRVTRINPAAVKMLEYQVDELVGKKIENFIHQKDRILALNDGEGIFQRKDGTYFPVEWINEPIQDEHDEITGTVTSFIDITKRKEAEISATSEAQFNALLAASEARFKNLFNKMEKEIHKVQKIAQMYLDIVGVTIIALDNLGRITLINRKGCETLKYEEEELIGKNWFDTVIPEDMKIYEKELFKSLINGEIDETDIGENIVLTKEGEERVISWRNMIIEDDNKRIQGVLSSGMDITGLKRSEKELKRILDSLYST
ncbi:MAG: PAS domain S-box protein [Promethearchaeota archaeon]